MIKDAYRRYQLLEGALEGDAEYLWLTEQARELAPRAEEILCALPEDQQRVLTEYMGLCQEKGWRMVELACFLP